MPNVQDSYDAIPVYFCRKCLSLKVLRLEGLGDPNACYCDDCGGTDIQSASFDEWEKLYITKYKKSYLKTNK